MPTKQETLLALPFDFLLSFAYDSHFLRRVWPDYTKKDVVHCLVRGLSEQQCEYLREEYESTRRYDRSLERILYELPTAGRLRQAFRRDVLESLGMPTGVIMEEVRLNGTRADIAVFNGHSSAYELKSPRDKMDRIQRQVDLYSEVFEYVSLVCYGHKVGNVDNHVGVIEVVRTSNQWQFKLIKDAHLNDETDPIAQLKLLRRDELADLVRRECCTRRRLSRSSMIKRILQVADRGEINEFFKSNMIGRALNSRTSCNGMTTVTPSLFS